MLTAIKREIDSNTIIVGDFKTPLSPMDRSSKMKINKETQALNDTLDKMGLIRSEEHTSELQSHHDLVCRLLLEKKK